MILEKRISGFNLFYLTKRIMKEELGITTIGDRVRLQQELNRLRQVCLVHFYRILKGVVELRDLFSC